MKLVCIFCYKEIISKVYKTHRNGANNRFKFWVSRSINALGVPALAGHTLPVASEIGESRTKKQKPLSRGVGQSKLKMLHLDSFLRQECYEHLKQLEQESRKQKAFRVCKTR